MESDSNIKIEKHLRVTKEDTTAIDLLAEHTDFSRQKIKQIMQKGAVWLTNGTDTKRIRRAKRTLKIGQELHLYYDANVLSQAEFEAELIADEKDYSVWYKPSGMLSQGSKYGDHCTLYRWVETHLKPQRNAFIVHRLDRATSGLILIAHSKKAAAILSRLFAQRGINKFYQVLVRGVPASPLTINEPLAGKAAISKILSQQTVPDSAHNSEKSLLEVQILTGRKHQIRQHLSIIGHPVIGDRLYGNGVKDNQNLCLTAYKIAFTSPFDQQKKHYELNKSYYSEFSR